MFYRGGSRSSSPIPGCIKYIFEDNGRILLVVQHQVPAGADTIDPFQHYPYFPARVYSAQVGEDLEVVRLEWVMCHYALWHFSENYDVVLPLVQVSVDTGGHTFHTFHLHIASGLGARYFWREVSEREQYMIASQACSVDVVDTIIPDCPSKCSLEINQ